MTVELDSAIASPDAFLQGKLTREGEIFDSVFSSAFSSAPHADMYRAWVFPDLYPDEPQPRLNNWPDEDLWMYCGIIKEGNAAH